MYTLPDKVGKLPSHQLQYLSPPLICFSLKIENSVKGPNSRTKFRSGEGAEEKCKL